MQNYQTLVLLGSYRRAKRLPGGEHMAGLTRILHRSAHDALSAVVPTWRAQPLHPGAPLLACGCWLRWRCCAAVRG